MENTICHNYEETLQELDTSPDLIRLLLEGLMFYFHDTADQLKGTKEIDRLALEKKKGLHQSYL
jgi:hypothetical protein